MTSIARKLQRAFERRSGLAQNDRPWLTEVSETNYRLLHPTRGWRTVSNKRVFARQKMAELLGH